MVNKLLRTLSSFSMHQHRKLQTVPSIIVHLSQKQIREKAENYLSQKITEKCQMTRRQKGIKRKAKVLEKRHGVIKRHDFSGMMETSPTIFLLSNDLF